MNTLVCVVIGIGLWTVGGLIGLAILASIERRDHGLSIGRNNFYKTAPEELGILCFMFWPLVLFMSLMWCIGWVMNRAVAALGWDLDE